MTNEPLMLQPATMDDAVLLLEWRNDDVTRRMSRVTSRVELRDHLAWMEASLKSENRRLLIATEGNSKIGTIRLDRLESDDGWEISWTVAPQFRGLGYGNRIVNCACNIVGCGKLVAEIKPENCPSIRIAESCHFKKVGEDDGLTKWVRRGSSGVSRAT